MKKPVVRAAVLAAVLVTGTAPALAQTGPSPDAVIICVLGEPCLGTPGIDAIIGTEGQDAIFGLEGDDRIAPQVDLGADFIFCGPGFDTVDPSVSTSPNFPAILQYEREPDVIADDCEQVLPAP